MSRKDRLKAQLEAQQQAADEIRAQIAQAEAAATHRQCHYRHCGKDFITDDMRRWYCCPEHYIKENRERTKDRNKIRLTATTN